MLIYLIKHCACFALVAELVPSGRLDVGGWFTGNALEVYEDPKYWCVSACFVLLILLNKHQDQPSKQHLTKLCFALVSHRWGLFENPLAPLLCFTLIALFHVVCTVN